MLVKCYTASLKFTQEPIKIKRFTILSIAIVLVLSFSMTQTVFAFTPTPVETPTLLKKGLKLLTTKSEPTPIVITIEEKITISDGHSDPIPPIEEKIAISDTLPNPVDPIEEKITVSDDVPTPEISSPMKKTARATPTPARRMTDRGAANPSRDAFSRGTGQIAEPEEASSGSCNARSAHDGVPLLMLLLIPLALRLRNSRK